MVKYQKLTVQQEGFPRLSDTFRKTIPHIKNNNTHVIIVLPSLAFNDIFLIIVPVRRAGNFE